ncbi:MAG: ATP-binding cassette domain-containing protein [Pseudanabaena sp. CRU_2_10]|nr:ATP-binding cassette domain-containing protein [Pseudanabaena sp. CRU_2_10]
MRTQPALQLQQVSFKTILSNISVTIDSGSQTAVVGASGSGKTTLLRLLNRLIDPTAGKIYIWGKDMQKLPVGKLRRQVMLVPQESSLLGMNVAEAIAYPLQLSGMPISQIQSRVSLWSEKLQIDSKLMQRSELQLSVGQRQWVAIARALATEPQILLLDEPTSALDRGRANLLLDILRELTTTTLAQPIAVIMVNHQLELVANWCSDLVQLHRGGVARSQPSQAVNWQEVQQSMQIASRNTENDDEWE